MTDWSGPEVPGLPVSRSQISQWRRFALRRPWRGDRVITDARHALDTSAILEFGRPTRLMLSLDVGYHASGWFKNPEYEQCLHLSVSHPRPDAPLEYKPAKPDIGFGGGMGMRLEAPTDAEVRAWGDVIFGQWNRLTWLEPPASVLDPYRSAGVAHLRLYLDHRLEPFMPKGEPYGLVAPPWSEKVQGSIGGDVR